MQDRWSSLLAAAADPNYSSTPLPSYVDILKQLSPIEAKLLDHLYIQYEKVDISERAGMMFSKELTCNMLDLSSEQFDLMASNLMRLNLIEPPASHDGALIGDYPIVVRTFELFQIIPLGRDFVRHARYGREQTNL